MDLSDRIYGLDRILRRAHYAVSRETLQQNLWFNASELHALLACQLLLANLQLGLLDGYLAPLRSRIEQLLGARNLPKDKVGRRIRILPQAARLISQRVGPWQTGASDVRRRRHPQDGPAQQKGAPYTGLTSRRSSMWVTVSSPAGVRKPRDFASRPNVPLGWHTSNGIPSTRAA